LQQTQGYYYSQPLQYAISLPADLPLQTVTQPLLSPCQYLCQLYLQPASAYNTSHVIVYTINYCRNLAHYT